MITDPLIKQLTVIMSLLFLCSNVALFENCSPLRGGSRIEASTRLLGKSGSLDALKFATRALTDIGANLVSFQPLTFGGGGGVGGRGEGPGFGLLGGGFRR